MTDVYCNYELICVIANYGDGSKIMHRSKQLGISGGTVLYGKGTVRNTFLNFLSLYDERKEIVLMATDSNTANDVLEVLNREFKFYKPHKGIAFSTDIKSIIGMSNFSPSYIKGEEDIVYHVITTIVDRGRAEEVIDAALDAGARGGTIINGRGSGIHETQKLFNMEIEPEKELVLIIADEKITDAIVQSVREKLEIDKPGKGIMFVQDARNVYGLR